MTMNMNTTMQVVETNLNAPIEWMTRKPFWSEVFKIVYK